MEDGNRTDNPFPIACDSVEIPTYFPREVSRINYQKLSKADVSPEQHKCEQEITELVKMLFRHRRIKGLVLLKPCQRENRKRESGQDLTDAKDNREHC